MSTEDKSAPDAGAKGNERPPATPPTVVEPTEIKLSSEAFKQRLDESRAAERKALLKKFGADSEADVERRLKAAKDAEEAQLSEKEKLAKRLEELEPAAARAKDLEERFAQHVQKRFDALPEHERKIVEAISEDADERDALLDYREQLRAAWQAEAAGSAPPAKSNGAPPPARTAPAAAAPKPGATPNMYERWVQTEQQNPVLGRLFYNANRVAIERDRPA